MGCERRWIGLLHRTLSLPHARVQPPWVDERHTQVEQV
jgi:hypothetical protein